MAYVVVVYVALLKTQTSKPFVCRTIAHTDGLQEAGDCETAHPGAVFYFQSFKFGKLFCGKSGLVQALCPERRRGAAYLQVSHDAAVSEQVLETVVR